MALVNLVCLVVVGVVLEVASLPAGVKYPTGKRIQIPSSFAKSYWVGGSAFTRDNFKGETISGKTEILRSIKIFGEIETWNCENIEIFES